MLADQLEAPGALERCLALPPRRATRLARARRRRRVRRRLLGAALRGGGRRAGAPRQPDRRLSPARQLDLGRHPRRPAAAGHRRRHPAAAGDRDRLPPRALRRLERRVLAARVRPRAVAGRAARGGGRARHVRRLVRARHHRAGALGRRDRARPARPPGASTACGTRAATRRTATTATRTGSRRAITRCGPTTASRTTRERGHARAREHAREFIASAPGVVAFDTELFGHFWHEGITFLETLLAGGRGRAVRGDGDAAAPSTSRPRAGAPGRDLRTWDGELAWRQRSAELRALSAPADPRALRELLALQASDWAFQIYNASAGDYPRERAAQHHAAFESALLNNADPELRNLAPQLADWAFVQP